MGTCETSTQIIACDGGHRSESLDAVEDEEVREEDHPYHEDLACFVEY